LNTTLHHVLFQENGHCEQRTHDNFSEDFFTDTALFPSFVQLDTSPTTTTTTTTIVPNKIDSSYYSRIQNIFAGID
jgi:hypothetical protein